LGFLDWLRRPGRTAGEPSIDQEAEQPAPPDDADDEWPDEDELGGDDEDPTVYPLW
jgi:hypothetical protein